MNESDHREIRGSRVAQSVDFSQEIASLRLVGADQFDPVRLHYMEVLANRANAHQGRVKGILDGKLAQALVAFRERFEQAQRDATDTIEQIAPHYPRATADLQRLLKAGDFRGVSQLIVTLKRGDHRASLSDLAAYIAQHSPENVDASFDGNVGLRSELKTTRYFRNTWSKLSVDKRVTQALDQVPKNAGPINSHMLVLRSLALMRDISPDYLNRFTSYVDTLLCLEQCDKEKQANAKKVADAENGKKIKGRRGRSR